MARKPTIPRVCQQCGKDFLATSGNVKQGYGKVCSVACRHASNTRRAVEQRRARFLAKITPVVDGCWEWPSSFGSHGYGQFQRTLAHRVAYELFVGPIPEGLQIDHLCRNRHCVNPAHLEAVTPRENTMRGFAPNMILHRSGRCKRGHEMTPENCRRTKSGHDACRACERERYRERLARRGTMRAAEVARIGDGAARRLGDGAD